jgi:hypothetical protein
MGIAFAEEDGLTAGQVARAARLRSVEEVGTRVRPGMLERSGHSAAPRLQKKMQDAIGPSVYLEKLAAYLDKKTLKKVGSFAMITHIARCFSEEEIAR